MYKPLPRRKPRQLAQKVRVESAVVEPVAEIVPEAVVAEGLSLRNSEPVKAELPAGWKRCGPGRKWRIP